MSSVVMRNLLPPSVAEGKSGDIGLELECEAKRQLPFEHAKTTSWAAKSEGSLRGYGIEYVSRRPWVMGERVKSKISNLCDVINQPAYGIEKDSPRTSLHVHLSVLDLTPVHVWTQVTLYWLLENLLTKYCGELLREGNLFCLRLKDAEGILPIAQQEINSNKPWGTNLFNNELRYAGQNLSAVRKFGSLEYRAMRGTTDKDVIWNWTRELHSLQRAAVNTFQTPEGVLDHLSKYGALSILRICFSEQFVEELLGAAGSSLKAASLVDENTGRLLHLVYSNDWKEYQTKCDTYYEKVLKDKPFPENGPKLQSIPTSLRASSIDWSFGSRTIPVSQPEELAQPTSQPVDQTTTEWLRRWRGTTAVEGSLLWTTRVSAGTDGRTGRVSTIADPVPEERPFSPAPIRLSGGRELFWNQLTQQWDARGPGAENLSTLVEDANVD